MKTTHTLELVEFAGTRMTLGQIRSTYYSLENRYERVTAERDRLLAENEELRNVLAEIAEACEQYNAKPDPYAMAEHARAALAKARHD